MRGENLYKSGKKGVSLLFDESSSFIIALGTRYYLLAAELLLGSLVFVLGYALLNFQERICEWRLPLFIMSLITFITASSFLENYGAIVETTYTCLLVIGNDLKGEEEEKEEEDNQKSNSKDGKKSKVAMSLGFIKRKNPIKAATGKLGSIFSDYGIKVPASAVI
ncbi:DgyrCDS13688 [Dimorphilus gyrociliatus]|uniref:Choline transporter-like protein n=1 Tax=Dimorphilus gyrociliatus TaxID=2664684 RepID=A0A7I8WBF9_9ANNE|nr:DgyrCDS13688 [Dimorphilus gyrociliatus]